MTINIWIERSTRLRAFGWPPKANHHRTSGITLGNLLLLILAASIFAAPVARAQGLASIVGTVTDASGAAIPGAKVWPLKAQPACRLKRPYPTLPAVTCFSALPPTTYDLTFSGHRFCHLFAAWHCSARRPGSLR